ADPSGIRGILRHRLARGAAAVMVIAATIGLVTGVGNPVPLAVVAALATLQVVLSPTGAQAGKVWDSDTGMRSAIVAWPIFLAVLVSAGWTSTQDLNEVVAASGFAMAMFVALTERRDVAVVWTMAT